jgi:hypothetical protein
MSKLMSGYVAYAAPEAILEEVGAAPASNSADSLSVSVSVSYSWSVSWSYSWSF